MRRGLAYPPVGGRCSSSPPCLAVLAQAEFTRRYAFGCVALVRILIVGSLGSGLGVDFACSPVQPQRATPDSGAGFVCLGVAAASLPSRCLARCLAWRGAWRAAGGQARRRRGVARYDALPLPAERAFTGVASSGSGNTKKGSN